MGSAIGSPQFVSDFAQDKVSEWVGQLKRLSLIAQSQPHAAYSALTHGLFKCIFRTTPHMEDLGPLEDCLRHKVLPSLTGQITFNEEMRLLVSLPARLGGLGIMSVAHYQYVSSLYITDPLVSSIIHSSPSSTV